MKILAIGEIIFDLYPDKSCIGGAPLNFAAHTSLLGAESAIISAVGNDDLGYSAKEYVENFRILNKYIKTNHKQTGICDVRLDERGVPSYSVRTDTAYDNIVITDGDTEQIRRERFDLFYFGTLIQRSERSSLAVKKLLSDCEFGEILCDVNLRNGCYSKESALLCLLNATFLKISDEEEPLLAELGIYEKKERTNIELAKMLTKAFPNLKVVIITMGQRGAFAYRASDGKSVYKEAKKVTLASTVGAGDSFAAAFAVSYLNGEDLDEAMEKATALAGFVCSHLDAVPKF